MSAQDSHFPNDTTKHETGPIPQRHRAAMGVKVNGETNPNGAESGPKDNKIAGQRKTY
jgi:hypothetical protein